MGRILARNGCIVVILLGFLLTAMPAHGDDLSASTLAWVELCRNLSLHVYTKFQSAALPTGVTRALAPIHDNATGLDVEIFKMQGPNGRTLYVMSIGGTEQLQDIATDILRGMPDLNHSRPVEAQYAKGLEIATTLRARARAEGADVAFTGHSMGGGIASYAGAMLGAPVVAFNAAALGEKIMRLLRPELKERANEQTLHVVTIGDPIFTLSARVPGAGVLGKVVLVSPAPGLDGVVSADLRLQRELTLWEQTRDRVARHLAPLNGKLFAPGDAVRTMSVDEALRPAPPVWWADRSDLQIAASHQQRLQAIGVLSQRAQRVVVAGSGPEADELARVTAARVGAANVLRVSSDWKAERIRERTADFRAALILGVRDESFAAPSPNERIFMRVENALRMNTALQTTSDLIAALKDVREAPASLRRMADFLNSDLGKDFASRWESAADTAEWGLAYVQDLDAFAHDRWTAADSQLVHRAMSKLEDAGLKIFWEAARDNGFGVDDFAKGQATEVVKGLVELADKRALTPGAADHLLRSIVRGSCGFVALRFTGSQQFAAKVADAANFVVDVGQTATAGIAQRAYWDASGNTDRVIELWEAQQVSNARRGASIVDIAQHMRTLGVDPEVIGEARRRLCDDYADSLRGLSKNWQAIGPPPRPPRVLAPQPPAASPLSAEGAAWVRRSIDQNVAAGDRRVDASGSGAAKPVDRNGVEIAPKPTEEKEDLGSLKKRILRKRHESK